MISWEVKFKLNGCLRPRRCQRNLTSKQSGKRSDLSMEKKVLRGGRPSLYRTLSVLSGVGESVDRVAGLCMIGRCVMVCCAVAASPITG